MLSKVYNSNFRLMHYIIQSQTSDVVWTDEMVTSVSWGFSTCDRNLTDFSGGPGQADLPDGRRDSGTIRQKLRERVCPSLPPQLQQGRCPVEVLEEPAGKRGEWPKIFLCTGWTKHQSGQDRLTETLTLTRKTDAAAEIMEENVERKHVMEWWSRAAEGRMEKKEKKMVFFLVVSFTHQLPVGLQVAGYSNTV